MARLGHFNGSEGARGNCVETRTQEQMPEPDNVIVHRRHEFSDWHQVPTAHGELQSPNWAAFNETDMEFEVVERAKAPLEHQHVLNEPSETSVHSNNEVVSGMRFSLTDHLVG